MSRALMDSIGSSATDNTFGTLVRHPSLLRQWISFTVALAVTGELPPRLRELAILRTGWLCRAEYEWGQHAVLARRVGISEEEIARVKSGPPGGGMDRAGGSSAPRRRRAPLRRLRHR